MNRRSGCVELLVKDDITLRFRRRKHSETLCRLVLAPAALVLPPLVEAFQDERQEARNLDSSPKEYHFAVTVADPAVYRSLALALQGVLVPSPDSTLD